MSDNTGSTDTRSETVDVRCVHQHQHNQNVIGNRNAHQKNEQRLE